MSRAGFEVIIIGCDESGRTTWGHSSRSFFPDLPSAHARAMPCRKHGTAVIIRPNFNEVEFFREWRSFNGNPWEERRWTFPLA